MFDFKELGPKKNTSTETSSTEGGLPQARSAEISLSTSSFNNYSANTASQWEATKLADRLSHDVGDYINKIRDIPRITREQELQLAETIREKRLDFTRLLLESRPVIQRALLIIDGVFDRTLRLDVVIDLDERSTDGFSKSRKVLECNGKTIKGIFARNEKLLAQLTEQDVPSLEQAQLSTKISANLKKMRVLLEECRLTHSTLERLYQALQVYNGETPRRIGSSGARNYQNGRSCIESILSAADEIQINLASLGEDSGAFKKRMELLEENLEKLLQARQEMANGNVRLVVAIAKQYKRNHAEFDDLIQEGNAGLMRAVDKFNPDFGAKFGTYATFWIKQFIIRSLWRIDPVFPLSGERRKNMAEVLRGEEHLTHNLRHEPSLEQLAEYLNQSVGEVSAIKLASRRSLLFSDVETIEERGILDLLEDTSSQGHTGDDLAIRQRELAKTLQQALEQLPDRLKEVATMRLKGKTLQDVGDLLGVTRERARQIEAQAFDRLRTHSTGELLISFLTS